jgi:Zn-dependent protease
VIGLLIALIATPAPSLTANIVNGLVYGFLLVLVEALHLIGHILTSRAVQPPLTEIRVRSILRVTPEYRDESHTPPYVHLVRAWGGPLLNTLIGTGSLLLWLNVGGNFLLFFAVANKLFFAMNLLPFAPLDGAVIWRETPRVFRPSR